ncbi:hypothetical protein JCM10213_001650 [Rhodosporidiobolus nylandii]
MTRVDSLYPQLQQQLKELHDAAKGKEFGINQAIGGFDQFLRRRIPDEEIFSPLVKQNAWPVIEREIREVRELAERHAGVHEFLSKVASAEGIVKEAIQGTALSLEKTLCQMSPRNENRYGVTQDQLRRRWG